MSESDELDPERVSLSAADRALLERYVPFLQYDAQDVYRATSAETMTDNGPNQLIRLDWSLIAKHPGLVIDTLARYPGGLSYEDGDRLSAGPDCLHDAAALQPLYPHGVYGRVRRPGRTRTWLQYWIWYYDNPKTFLGRGRHQGDWELVQIGLDADDQPAVITGSQHTHGDSRRWWRIETVEEHPEHAVVYVAPFSHANYLESGTRYYFPAADHPTTHGPRLKPDVLDFDTWEGWPGHWGATRNPFKRPLRFLGAESPESPCAQGGRWDHPWRFWAGGVRPDKSALKKTIWWVGKGTFPKAPQLEAVQLDDQLLEVRYAVRKTLLQRARDLLVTVHDPIDVEQMLLSSVVRRIPEAGTARFYLPHKIERVAVYASTFNKFGQRSDPVGPYYSAREGA